MVGRNTIGARKCRFETAANARTMYRSDDGLSDCLEPIHEGLAFTYQAQGFRPGFQPGEFLYVSACYELVGFSRNQDCGFGFFVCTKGFQDFFEFKPYGARNLVYRFTCNIQFQPRDAF
jgi:hypothetical protein